LKALSDLTSAATAAAIIVTMTQPALAHQGGVSGGVMAGFSHPLFGLDHVVAMIAVGLWGAFLGAPALWVLPIVFPMVMALGGALGVRGLPLTHVEVGIALSAVVLGFMVALAARPPLWVAAIMVAAFAIFHGYAHGTELPQSANPLAYSIGFVVSTGLLHLAGIAFGLLAKWRLGRIAVRIGGAAIAAAGVVFLVG
jgi:urease accessory protein